MINSKAGLWNDGKSVLRFCCLGCSLHSLTSLSVLVTSVTWPYEYSLSMVHGHHLPQLQWILCAQKCSPLNTSNGNEVFNKRYLSRARLMCSCMHYTSFISPYTHLHACWSWEPGREHTGSWGGASTQLVALHYIWLLTDICFSP